MAPPLPPTIRSNRTSHFRAKRARASAFLRGEARIDTRVGEILLDAQEPVVLRDALGAAKRARLYEARVHGDREVCDRRVLRLARAVGDDRDVSRRLRDPHRLERLGDRADLV